MHDSVDLLKLNCKYSAFGELVSCFVCCPRMRGQVVLGLYEASRAGFVRKRVERYCGFIFL
eukprot:SAG31_NODE_28414_length_410_cov_1.437299_1_plen_60_part_10